MKLKSLILCLALLSSFSAMAFEKVKLSGQMYIAKGFDDNDLVEIVLVGVLPNTCYTNPTYDISRENSNYTINLYAHYIKTNQDCKDTNLPYLETISFGMVNKGKYVITLNDPQGKKTQNLTVTKSSSGLKDDFTYGNVTGVVENDSDRTIEIVGVNPVNCMKLEGIVENIQNSLIVIQPKFVEQGFCQMTPTPFKIKYTVPYLKNQPRGIMLHVRIMDGRSFNYLYQNRLK